jgi:peptidoglycan/LPS O-acetylase OafA/YrhL
VFYVLSAYTLSFSLLANKHKEFVRRLHDFWVRRVLRILPVTLLLFALLGFYKVLLLDEQHDVGYLFFRLISMTYIFDESVRLVIDRSVWWSVATEFQFCLAMPLVFYGLLQRSQKSCWARYLVALSVLLAGIGVSALAQGLWGEKVWLGRSLPYHAIPFCSGVALAILVAAKGFQATNVWWPVLGLAGAGFGLLFAVSLYPTYEHWFRFGEIRLGVLIIVIATCTLVIAGRWLDESSTLLINFRLLRTVGILSFLVYLLHVPVMQLLQGVAWPMVGSRSSIYLNVLLTGLCITLILSMFVHYFVEQPVLSRSKYWSSGAVSANMVFTYVAFVFFSTFFALGLF